MKAPKDPDIKIHIDSSEPEAIKERVNYVAALYCFIYQCAVVVTETVFIGEDGKQYLGFEIEKKTSAVNH